MTPFRKLYRGALAALAVAGLAGVATAQECRPIWTGTWNTTYGQLRLIEDGTTVYGDYANVGVIKAKIARPCDRTLRGVFVRKDGGKGFIEFWQSEGDDINGRWNWLANGLPDVWLKRGVAWEGTFDTGVAPPILNFKPGESRDSLTELETRYHNWARLTDIAAERAFEEQRAREAKRRAEEAAIVAAEQASWSTNTGMTIPWRDIGVIIHHTRFPYLITPSSFRAYVHQDKNFTKNIVGGSGSLRASPLRMAISFGDVFDERSSVKYPADVVMGVYEQTHSGRDKSYCVVSYRGTDQDVKYFAKRGFLTRFGVTGDAFGVFGEGEIATKMQSSDLDRSGGTCTVKEGYHDNYLETQHGVLKFLSDATDAGHCQDGVVIAGMSLGGATASVAMADMYINQARDLPSGRLKTLINAGKVWMVNEGAPRALAKSCVNRLPAGVKQRTTRFVYGSPAVENAANPGKDCPRFIDPVPGNPSGMRVGTSWVDAEHFGQVVVGYVPKPGGYDPRPFLRELADKPVRTAASRVKEVACFEDPLNRCQSARWANDHSRSAGPSNQIATGKPQDFGGSCSGPELQPTRKYLFGRLHDTCSYRNLMAAYGQREGEFTSATNYQCNFPPNPDDEVDGPKEFTSWGYKIKQSQSGPRQ
ncbi:lipase family protein [Henriciella litoralis]|uniref:lipase family protein n=1 Tax=Henriciella litoralis TaxID=568102 RepID=UPI000A04FFE8|nr:hypothetical protein [Henriciella litoralis]